MTSIVDRFGNKSICGGISLTLFWMALGTQIGMLAASLSVLLLLIVVGLFVLTPQFALRKLQESPESFMRVQLWTSSALAFSTLLMHLLGVLFGSAGGMFIPETATTAIAIVTASTAAASCLTRLVNEKSEIFRRIPRTTTWLLSFTILNILLTLPSAILFIRDL